MQRTSSSSGDGPAPKLRRISRACEPCRIRKDRCNGKHPCNNCTARYRECVYSEVRKKRGIPQGYKKTLEEKVTIYETALCHLSGSLLGQVDSAIRDLVSDPRKVPSETAIQEWRNSPINELLMQLSSTPRQNISSPSETADFFTPQAGPSVPEPALSAESLSIHESPEFPLLDTPALLEFTNANIESDLGLSPVMESVNIRSNEKSIEQYIRLLPSHAAQAKLLEIYFADSHPYLPFLDYKQCVDISTYMLFSDPLSSLPPPLPQASSKERYNERALLLLFAIFLLALSHVREPIDGVQATTDEIYGAVIDLLHQLEDHFSLETVQVSLMLTWREQGTDLSQQAWLHLGKAIRVAQDLGLDRSTKEWPLLSPAEKRARQLSWWGCYVLDVVTSVRLGRKPVIREDDFDIATPEDPGVGDIGLQVFVRVIRLCRILSHIVETFYPVRKRSVNPELQQVNFSLLQGELIAWQNSLPQSLKITPGQQVAHPVHTMHLLFHTAMLLLQRPFLSAPRNNDSLYLYRSSAFESSTILASYRDTHHFKHSNPFVVHYIYTDAIAHIQSSHADESSVALAANFGLQECLNAFLEIRSTWKVAGRALDLLFERFNLGNVIYPNLPLPDLYQGQWEEASRDWIEDGHLLEFAPLDEQGQISVPTGLFEPNVLLAHAGPLDTSDHSARILEEL